MPPARFPFPRLLGGLDVINDSLADDLNALESGANVRQQTGVLSQRPGFRCDGIEPSYLRSGSAKSMTKVAFVRASSQYATTGTITAAKRWTLGTKWTCLVEYDFANATNATNGGAIVRTSSSLGSDNITDAIFLYMAGNGTQITVAVIIGDVDGNQLSVTSVARTVAAWQAIPNYRQIRIVRDGTTATLYIGGVSQGTGTNAAMGVHATQTAMQINSANIGVGLVYATADFYQATLVNRVLTESESYWGINYPVDPAMEDTGILGNWIASAASGTTIKDYSSFGNDLSLTNAPTWTSGLLRMGRGLGVYSWRLRDGSKYHIIGASRNGTDSSGVAASGAIYIWKANQEFFPFKFGGITSPDDSTASLSGLDLLARMSFFAYNDILHMVNGSDFPRKCYISAGVATWQYLSGTAPPIAPVLTDSGAGSNWTYCFTWYNSTSKTETGRSPTANLPDTTFGCTIQTWLSTDAQFDKARIYRTVSGGTEFFLVGEVAAGAAFTELVGNTDANIINLPPIAGRDASGNRSEKRLYLAGGPLTALTTADGGAGNVNAGLHYYAYSWYNSTTGAETGMSPAATFTNGGARTVSLSVIMLPPSGTDYDQMRIYRTKATAFQWFLVASATAATTYSDTTADSGITGTIETRALPPKASFSCIFAGRAWYLMADGTLWWSTSGRSEDVPWENAHNPNPGAAATGMCSTEEFLYVHYADGRIYSLPHPGNNFDLQLFVPINLREWAPYGATVGHYTIQKMPDGLVWMAKDGFYKLSGQQLQFVSSQLTPTFLNINIQRARYACAVYDESQQVYKCWLSQGNARLNESVFVLDRRTGTWSLDDAPHADAAGILYDGQGIPHFVALAELGALVDFNSETNYYDGDGSGTLSGTVTGAGSTYFTNIGSRTAPTGMDAGYPIWFVKSDGTVAQRFVMPTAMGIGGGTTVNFYPSCVAIQTGTWTVYFHGIRGRARTTKTDCGDIRREKTMTTLFVNHAKESAGTLAVKYACNDGSQVTSEESINLNENMASQASIRPGGACRTIDFEMIHHPPSAGESFKIVSIEVEFDWADGDMHKT